MKEEYKNIKLVVFDLDGTLAPSKESVDAEMALLIQQLLEKKLVAVIGGGKYELFEQQLVSKLDLSEQLLSKLFLFPMTSTVFYRYNNGAWQRVYNIEFSSEEKKKILDAFDKAFVELNYHPEDTYWKVVEDRGSEITFSALGQNAPADLKIEWNKENSEFRFKIIEILHKYIPEMEVRAAGLTSIDVTHKGIDKEYGMKQIKNHLGVDFDEMIFIGDSLYPGGNDEPVLRTGVTCIKIEGPEDTKKIIRDLI
ncbi:MAG: HAD-IIB family hydrolase [Patescibacteria group bacterium]